MPNTTNYPGSILPSPPTNGWSNTSNLSSANSVFGSVSTGGNYVDFTNFGFSIPSDDSIDGIILESLAYQSVATISCSVCQLLYFGLVGTNKSGSFPSISAFTSSPAQTVAIGSSSDLWGYSLTPSVVNNSAFGIRMSFSVTSGTYFFDYFRLNVYYTTGGGIGAGASVTKKGVKMGVSTGLGFGKRSSMKGLM